MAAEDGGSDRSPSSGGVKYHARTLAVLGAEGQRRRQLPRDLMMWANDNKIPLPAAFLEWAVLDPGFRLLNKYSNMDHFYGDKPILETMPDGTRSLLFHIENQGNFHRIIMLDQGDDPPVSVSFYGEPWVRYAERFSDCVYAQIFDWQYWLRFDPDNPEEVVDMAYAGDIDLVSERSLAELRKHFEEGAATHYVFGGKRYDEYRFLKSQDERINAMVEEDGRVSLRITGQREKVVALEDALRVMLVAEVAPDT